MVNTCGFIEEAQAESLDAIAEAMEHKGRVIVTGCLGVHEEQICKRHADLLAVTGPHATQEVMRAIHTQLPGLHSPFTSLLPPGGIKLMPRHYA